MFFFYVIAVYALVVFLARTQVYDRIYGGALPPKKVHYWKTVVLLIFFGSYTEYLGLWMEAWYDYSFVITGIIYLVFAIANRHIFSFWLLAGGILMNVLAVASNGGYMPWSPFVEWALTHGGIEGAAIGERGVYLSEPNLELLVDRFLFFLPSGQRWAWSIGDAILASGIFYFISVEVEDLK